MSADESARLETFPPLETYDSLEEEREASTQRWEAVHEHNRELGEGLAVGKIVTFPVADGSAVYEVLEIDEEVSTVRYREDLVVDFYHSQAVNQGRIFTDTLESACKRADFDANW